MKNSLILASFLAMLLISCQQKTEKQTTTADTTGMIAGGDLDEHGCKGSAGYTWSVVRNECIRTFEVGVRLAPQDSTLNQTLSAFVVFADDKKGNELEAEIFLPYGSIILKPIKDNSAGTWGNDTYTLTHWKGMYSLSEGKKTLYQGHR